MIAEGLIAIVTEDAVALRETLRFQPAIEGRSATHSKFVTVLIASAFNVVDSKKLAI